MYVLPRMHHSHADILHRLRRAQGHLETVLGMIEAGKDCVLVAQQMHAVEQAITNAKVAFIRDHIDHCLDDAAGKAPKQRSAAMDEFKTITKYL